MSELQKRFPPDKIDVLQKYWVEAEAECDRLRARVAELEAMLKECADELAAEIEARYDRVKDHPAMTPRYERDMDTVVRARAVLAKGRDA